MSLDSSSGYYKTQLGGGIQAFPFAPNRWTLRMDATNVAQGFVGVTRSMLMTSVNMPPASPVHRSRTAWELMEGVKCGAYLTWDPTMLAYRPAREYEAIAGTAWADMEAGILIEKIDGTNQFGPAWVNDRLRGGKMNPAVTPPGAVKLVQWWAVDADAELVKVAADPTKVLLGEGKLVTMGDADTIGMLVGMAVAPKLEAYNAWRTAQVYVSEVGTKVNFEPVRVDQIKIGSQVIAAW